MKRSFEFMAIVLAVFLIAQPMVAFGASNVRMVPSGNVSILDNGKEVEQFQSEMPLPQGMLMACNGSCVIQIQNIQLVAQDKAVFALMDGDARWDLTVKSGRIDFAFRADASPVAFRTPHDLILTQRIIIPAGTEAVVRGYINVTADKTELAVEQGALQVSSRNGTQVIEPGSSIVLAQAQVPSPPQPQEDNRPKGGYIPPGSGGTGISTTTWVVGGLAAAGVVAGVAVAATQLSGSNPVSPE